MSNKPTKMVPVKLTMRDMIIRQHRLETIIVELREALKYYVEEEDDGYCARQILKKWDIPWDKIYEIKD